MWTAGETIVGLYGKSADSPKALKFLWLEGRNLNKPCLPTKDLKYPADLLVDPVK